MHCLLAGLAVTVAAWLSPPARAQDYPDRPIHVIVDGAPGSTSDLWARRYALPLQARLRQPLVVENRPGASGSMAVQALMHAPADGYTVLYATAQVISYPGSGGVVSYDPVRDLVPVAFGTTGHPILLVSSGTGVRSIQELVVYARAQGQPLSCGTGGQATTGHFACALAAQALGIPLLIVPYRSVPAAVQDAGAGTIQLTAAFYTEAQGLVASGHLTPLAVFSDRRFARLAQVPTFGELGYPHMALASFNGFYFAARTPAPVIKAFNKAARWAMQQKELTQPIQAIGSLNLDFTAQEFSDFVRDEYATWRRRSDELHIKVEH